MNHFAECAQKTFHNLPDDKRNRIIDMAVREFAEHGYRKASLNTLVKRLGIAKGSLYQYFANKEALFLYVFSCFTEKVKKAVKEVALKRDGEDFFGLVKSTLWAGIGFIDSYPQYFQVYTRVLYETGVPFREDLVRQVRLFSIDFFGPLCEEARKQGLVRPELTAEMVVFVLDALLDRFLQGYAGPCSAGGPAPANKDRMALTAEVDMIMEILKNGLSS